MNEKAFAKPGSKNHMSKLSEDQVAQIRSELLKRDGLSNKDIISKGLSQSKIAHKFGVSQTLISMISNDKVRKTKYVF